MAKLILIIVPLLLTTSLCFSADQRLGPHQEMQLKFLNFNEPTISPDKRIKLEEAIRSGNVPDTIPVERIDKNALLRQQIKTGGYGVLSIKGVDPLREKNGRSQKTVSSPDGLAIAKHYGIEISTPELKVRQQQTGNCTGEINNGIGQKKMIEKCFTSLSNNYLIITPDSALEKTYTRALSSLSSLVNDSNKHICDVSVVKKGLWITARHCIEDNDFKKLKIISENKLIKINSISKCTGICDIAFLYADTPDAAEIPTVLDNKHIISNKTPIFIPGIPYLTSLSDIFSPESQYKNKSPTPLHAKIRYNNLVMWSPYNEGFCMVMNVEQNGCLAHACSTVAGFSGAPIYAYNKDNSSIILVGIHSGADPDLNECSNKNEKANYGKIITAEALPK